MTDCPLEAKDLYKGFGDICAISNLSLKLQSGEIFGLLGPNGAGKTTLISMIITLLSIDRGNISIFGHDVVKSSRSAKLCTGAVPQEMMSHGYFDVESVLEFQSGYYGVTKNRKHIDYLLKRLNLWEHRHKQARALSGGMKRRLLIAKALVHKPRLLLLDEPTAGVDVELRSEMWEYIRVLNGDGLTVLMTTHYLQEAEELCGRIGIIHKGKLQLVDKTRNIVESLTLKRVEIELEERMQEPFQAPFLVSQEGKLLVFRVPHHLSISELFIQSKLDFGRVKDIRIKEGNLEEAFLEVIGG